MRLEISELHQQLKTTMIYVTHDQVEAMTMADKIVVLNAGNIEQVGSPMELYKTPEEPVRRRLHRLAEDEPDRRRAGRARRRRDDRHPPRAPRHLRASAGEWKGTVGVAEHLGSDTFLHVHTDGAGPMTVRADGEFAVHHGDTIYLTPDPAKLHRFDATGKAMLMTAGAARTRCSRCGCDAGNRRASALDPSDGMKSVCHERSNSPPPSSRRAFPTPCRGPALSTAPT